MQLVIEEEGNMARLYCETTPKIAFSLRDLTEDRAGRAAIELTPAQALELSAWLAKAPSKAQKTGDADAANNGTT
jgi:hypothetical protein